MTTNVGRMPYLNSALFYQAFPDSGPDALRPMVPTAMAGAAREGRVDAGPIPLLDALALDDTFEPLGGYCIATTVTARSILLFSTVPIEQLTGRTVGVTDETSTSGWLLRVLLSQRFQVRPSKYVGVDDPNDAVLYIGDTALRFRGGIDGRPHVYDLGEEWHRWTALPTVFALWIVRRDLPQGDKDRLAATIQSGLDQGLDKLPEARDGVPDLGMSGADVREYLEGFSFTVGDHERRAIKEFTGLVQGLARQEEALHAG